MMFTAIKKYFADKPHCNACKRPIFIGYQRMKVDMFDRLLHERCYKKTNMSPEIVLLLRACFDRLGNGKPISVATFTKEEVLASNPISITKIDDGSIQLTSYLGEDAQDEETVEGGDDQEDDI